MIEIKVEDKPNKYDHLQDLVVYIDNIRHKIGTYIYIEDYKHISNTYEEHLTHCISILNYEIVCELNRKNVKYDVNELSSEIFSYVLKVIGPKNTWAK